MAELLDFLRAPLPVVAPERPVGLAGLAADAEVLGQGAAAAAGDGGGTAGAEGAEVLAGGVAGGMQGLRATVPLERAAGAGGLQPQPTALAPGQGRTLQNVGVQENIIRKAAMDRWIEEAESQGRRVTREEIFAFTPAPRLGTVWLKAACMEVKAIREDWENLRRELLDAPLRAPDAPTRAVPPAEAAREELARLGGAAAAAGEGGGAAGAESTAVPAGDVARGGQGLRAAVPPERAAGAVGLQHLPTALALGQGRTSRNRWAARTPDEVIRDEALRRMHPQENAIRIGAMNTWIDDARAHGRRVTREEIFAFAPAPRSDIVRLMAAHLEAEAMRADSAGLGQQLPEATASARAASPAQPPLAKAPARVAPPAHRVSDLPVRDDWMAYHNIILLSNRLPRRMSTVLAQEAVGTAQGGQGAAGGPAAGLMGAVVPAPGGGGGAWGGADMDISDGDDNAP